jgi:hypothetical protein
MKKSILALILLVFGTVFALGVSAQTKKIGMKRAKEIAAREAAGKIEESELEKENGKLVYSFDIRNAKGTITEVQVDAYSGKVVSVEEEDAQKEATEKQAEKAEKKKIKH